MQIKKTPLTSSQLSRGIIKYWKAIFLTIKFFVCVGKFLGPALCPNYPCPSATLSALHLHFSTLALRTPQKVLSNWKLAELKTLNFSDGTRVSISIITSAADSNMKLNLSNPIFEIVQHICHDISAGPDPKESEEKPQKCLSFFFFLWFSNFLSFCQLLVCNNRSGVCYNIYMCTAAPAPAASSPQK